MAHELSPAVERAAEAAVESARLYKSESVRLTDWILGLIADDEGKPAILLTRLGADPDAVRNALTTRPDWVHPPAPSATALYTAGREKAVLLRADPTLTTEFVLLAVLEADPRFRDQLAGVGVHWQALEGLLSTRQHAPSADTEPGPTFAVTEPTVQADAGRVMDANLNRAREALRVLEDYCRFVLNDRVLTGQVKELRHELAAASASLPAGVLLAARDTPGDVGTAVTSSGEYERISPAQVAAVNLKRLQEALRSIEEFGKVFGEGFGRQTEAIRYRTYTLERAVVRGAGARTRLADARLYVLLTGSQCTAALDWTIAEAAAGGARVFQLREKDLSDRELLDRVRNVRRWTRDAGALFIVNDRPDIARLAEADGVHLGQDDMRVADARRIVGPDALIGVSTQTIEQVRRAVLDGADYLGVGPTFPSRTKPFDHFPGLDFIRRVADETTLPAFALGGITPANVRQIVEAGAKRIAVSASVAEAADPEAVARQILSQLGDLP
jgi:thiamine-phosphate pyrophosphorylase